MIDVFCLSLAIGKERGECGFQDSTIMVESPDLGAQLP